MSRFFRRRKYCRFTAEGITEIDYKDLEMLKGYVTETGKIVPSRITALLASSTLTLATVLPPMVWFSAAAIALYVMRHGGRSGLFATGLATAAANARYAGAVRHGHARFRGSDEYPDRGVSRAQLAGSAVSAGGLSSRVSRLPIAARRGGRTGGNGGRGMVDGRRRLDCVGNAGSGAVVGTRAGGDPRHRGYPPDGSRLADRVVFRADADLFRGVGGPDRACRRRCGFSQACPGTP